MGSAPDSRRLQRIARLNALFSWEFYHSVGEELDPAAHPFDEEVPVEEGAEEVLGVLTQPELLAPILEHIPAIDGAILRFAPKHDLEHFNKVDLAILRQALYELLYTSTPAAVVIDEAIELAKLYATSEAPSFVHGVLGNIADERKKEQAAEAEHKEEENKEQHAA